MPINDDIQRNLSIAGSIVTVITGIYTIYDKSPWYISIVWFLISIVGFIWIFKRYFKHGLLSYEILKQDLKIDILDDQGSEVKFTNESSIITIKNNVQLIRNGIYSDGTIDNFEVINGIIKTVEYESGRYEITTELPYPLGKGQRREHTFSCSMHNSFMNKNEYWKTTKYHNGAYLKITVLFPLERGPKSTKAFRIHGTERVLADEQPTITFMSGRSLILLEIKKVTQFDAYRLEWVW